MWADYYVGTCISSDRKSKIATVALPTLPPPRSYDDTCRGSGFTTGWVFFQLQQLFMRHLGPEWMGFANCLSQILNVAPAPASRFTVSASAHTRVAILYSTNFVRSLVCLRDESAIKWRFRVIQDCHHHRPIIRRYYFRFITKPPVVCIPGRESSYSDCTVFCRVC